MTGSRYTQFLPFAIIGFVNTFIHGSILVLSVERLDLDITASHLLAFFIANMFSYIANSKITFKSPITLLRYKRFFLASLLSLSLTLLLSWVANFYGLHYLAGFALIVVLVPVLNFIVIKTWVFAIHPASLLESTRIKR
ncbi:MAG: GtrA family protein [Halothiobacillaceae bacterium]